VAQLAGVSREQVIRLEHGVCTPRLDTARRLAVALGADVGVLFSINEEGRPATNGTPSETSAVAGPTVAVYP
jgi:DNA-binding XRE family transcriptional regulator